MTTNDPQVAPTACKSVRSQCPYCGVGCGIELTVQDNKVVRVQGDPQHPANYGQLCIKGATLASAIDTPNRLTQAYVRDGRESELRPAELSDAVRAVADRLSQIVAEHGPDAVALYISGQLTTEAAYLISKFCKGALGTNNVDANSRLCMASAVVGYQQAFGSDGPPCSYADIEEADCFFMVGSNAAECHPITQRRIEKQIGRNGAKLVVVDPRRTATARLADLHLPIRPGSDSALMQGILHLLIKEDAIDRSFIEAHTGGWERIEQSVAEWTPERTAEATGLDADSIVAAARIFGESKRTMTLWSMGVNQSSNAVSKVHGIINIHLATGKIGRAGCGPFSLTGQPNAMGGREAGYLAHQLPGYRQVTVAEHRQEIERAWGVPAGRINPRPGAHAVEMFEALGTGRIKAIWIICTNPVSSMPDLHAVQRGLRNAEFVVVQDAFSTSQSLQFADVVLPAAQWAEQEGTFTSSGRHTTLLNKAVEPPGDAFPDWQLVQAVAHSMGFGSLFPYTRAEEIYDEFRQLTAGRYPLDISGMNYRRLGGGPLQWPCPTTHHAGTERLYEDGYFATPDGRARFIPAAFVPPGEQPDEEYPFWLTTGRVLEQWHSRTRTGEVLRLNQKTIRSFIELHPDDAAALGVAEGDMLDITSRRGSCSAGVRITPLIAAGTVFMPIHWQDGNPNWATTSLCDPQSKQPELKACAVALSVSAQLPKIAFMGSTPEHVRVNAPGSFE